MPANLIKRETTRSDRDTGSDSNGENESDSTDDYGPVPVWRATIFFVLSLLNLYLILIYLV